MFISVLFGQKTPLVVRVKPDWRICCGFENRGKISDAQVAMASEKAG